MSDSKPVRCQKCGKSLGYVTVAPKNFSTAKPSVDNLKLVAACPECSGERVFTEETFNMHKNFQERRQLR